MQPHEPVLRKTSINPLRDALAVSITIFLVTVACSTVMYHYASRGLLHEVQETLFHVARTAAVMTDGDLHQTLTDNAQKGSEAYLKVQKPYRDILAANPEIPYIYTVVEKNGKAYFIIDTKQPKAGEVTDASRDSTADIMEEYTKIPPTMMKALKERVMLAQKETYTDEWGTFISAYVPIYNSNKEYLGIVGADLDASDFLARMNSIRIPYALGLLFALAFSVGVAMIIYHIRKDHADRSAARKKQVEMMLEFHQHISDVIKAVSGISFKIDGKTAQIAGIAQTSAEKTIEAQHVIQGSSDKMQAISDSVSRLLEVVKGLSNAMEAHANTLKEKITQVIHSTNHSHHMNGAMKNISGVVGIINEINERIDLLALNAAIEAARAGEAGKGFMVVANEIKTLSAQAGDSAAIIARHIRDMDAMVTNAVSTMGNTDGLEEQVNMITRQTQTVINEQQEIVSYINEDIQDVTARALQIINMVHSIAEMAADTGAKTMHMHKDVHLLYEQNASLSEEVEQFIKKL